MLGQVNSRTVEDVSARAGYFTGGRFTVTVTGTRTEAGKRYEERLSGRSWVGVEGARLAASFLIGIVLETAALSGRDIPEQDKDVLLPLYHVLRETGEMRKRQARIDEIDAGRRTAREWQGR